ncbi:11269_t:CDS:2 [Ambispora gerdemannii]|uniref:11269_t:CDS:1 n=1 Tax=Ambispora gerdemannii TaxID=144530 RepID=A0A9N8UXT1_9GLOM|nr:11269_t:CDS:2 [Ambispora gerdemannii]
MSTTEDSAIMNLAFKENSPNNQGNNNSTKDDNAAQVALTSAPSSSHNKIAIQASANNQQQQPPQTPTSTTGAGVNTPTMLTNNNNAETPKQEPIAIHPAPLAIQPAPPMTPQQQQPQTPVAVQQAQIAAQLQQHLQQQTPTAISSTASTPLHTPQHQIQPQLHHHPLRPNTVSATTTPQTTPSGKPPVGSEEWHRQRRENHKEVERRRRDTINAGINELAKIVPGCEKNKGSILNRAVQYIQQLKENEAANIEKWTLEKLLTDQAIQDLQAQLDMLKSDNTRLRSELDELQPAKKKQRTE